MNKYTDVEIQTAKNLLKHGYKWIAMDESGGLFAYTDKPSKLDTFWCSDGMSNCVCYYVPIFQNIRFGDKEPVSLESIVHPQILDDAEKRYLKGVIMPFRKSVTSIRKEMACNTARHRIVIYVSEYGCCYLPWFNSESMYKGMELCKAYTLKELGL